MTISIELKNALRHTVLKIFIQSLDHFGRSHVKSCYSTLNSYHLKGDFQRHETFVSGKYANNFCKLPCGALSDIIPQAVGKKKMNSMECSYLIRAIKTPCAVI